MINQIHESGAARVRLGRWLLAGAAAGAFVAPHAAIAQTQTAPQASTSSGLSEIIVTANRREERAQDVPIAITALSPERLEQQGITKAQDLQASIPSLVVGPNGQGSRETQSFTLRGQGATFQASPGVVMYMNEVPVPTAVSLSQMGGPGQFIDIENLQVLAGPQGTLFGRNTTGGAVLIVPKKPQNEFGGWIKGEYGNYDRKYIEGAINVPIVEDKLLLRVMGAFHDRDGYTRDVQWNKDRDNEHWYTTRVGLTFRPTDTIENYTMAYYTKSSHNGAGLIHKGFNIDGLINAAGPGKPGLCAEGPYSVLGGYSCDVYRAATAKAEALGNRKTAFSIDTMQKTKVWGISNTTDIDLSDEIKLRNIFSYQRMQLKYRYDGDATVLQQQDNDPGVLPGPGEAFLPGIGTPIVYSNATGSTERSRDNFKQITEELQLQGDMLDSKLTWTIGGFYFEQKPVGTQISRGMNYCPAVQTGQCAPSYLYSGVASKSKALYAQATLDMGAATPALDGLRVTAGYRYTWDTIKGYSTQFSRLAGSDTLWKCGYNATITNTFNNIYDTCLFNATLKTKAPTWLLGLDYKVTDKVLVFAKVSRGYKAGGFNPYAVFDNTRTFNPEKVTSYEIGLKSDFNLGDVPFRFNTSLYQVEYKGLQRATGDFNVSTGAGGARTLNADARIKGIEIEASVRPVSGLEIGGNFSYTHAKYKKYTYEVNTPQLACNGYILPKAYGGTGIADSSCLDFQYVSPYIWSVHASYDHDLGDMGSLNFFVNFSHTSSQNTEAIQMPQSQPGAVLEPFGLLNASIDWRNVAGSGFDVGVFGTNLTKETYRVSNNDVYQSGGLLYWSTLYGEPRMYGVRLTYRFGGEK
ncbi:putative TonB-dependent receptor [Caenibius tardaugens NBRC 16725]|uniref:Putative TonB-dependent receptor n=1 Tax=Caenibius tardaugens NBRC 16725 TaxID=1219035 RepID=U2Y5R1_9SPHN|nr:TonB-dependent receptor [Caenibius tardaugens]GAD48466.1 putative TonB-dependent receptor [Caenibius tardaugens NBRC 16725]